MMNSINESFVDYVKTNINSIKNTYGIKDDGHAFASWIIGYINELSDDESINYTDTLFRGDGGLDGWYFDEEEQIFHLYQVKYSENPCKTKFNSAPVSEILNALDIVKDYSTAISKSRKLGNISRQLLDAREEGASIVLNCIVFGTLDEKAREEMKNRCITNQMLPKYEIWDIKRLYDLYVSREIDEDLFGVEMKVELIDANYITVNKPNNNCGIEESLVINLGCKALASAAKNYTPKIFGSNVRYNLGHRNKVNAKIQETLTCDTESSEFWHRNNGITILVNDYRFDDNKIILTNPQIVNGCQTVSTMIESIDSINDSAIILSKIVKVENSEIGKCKALDISESTNSQSPVKSSDLKSNDGVQMAIQISFKNLDEPWFYERKRGEWKSLDKAEKKRYNKRCVKMIDIGQTWLSYIGEPVQAISTKELLFSDTETYKKVFVKSQDVREYLLAKKLFDKFNNYIGIDNLDKINCLAKNVDEKMLQKLLQAKKLVVGHSVAMSKIILETLYKKIDRYNIDNIIKLIDNDDIFFEKMFKYIIMSHRMLVSQKGDDIGVQKLYKDKNTIKILIENLNDYLDLMDIDKQFNEVI